jgi:hypothetical protein
MLAGLLNVKAADQVQSSRSKMIGLDDETTDS